MGRYSLILTYFVNMFNKFSTDFSPFLTWPQALRDASEEHLEQVQHAAVEQAVRMEWSAMARPSGSQGDAGHGHEGHGDHGEHGEHGGHGGHGDGDLEDLGFDRIWVSECY